jgi:hypothetical protein
VSIEAWSLVVSVVSAAVASAAFVVARRDPTPRIRGQINQVVHAPLELPDGSVITAIMLHVTLTNSRKNPTSIISYDLHIDRGRGPEPVTRLRDLRGFPELVLGDRRVHLTDETLIYRPMRPVEYGAAQVGLLVFYVEAEGVLEDHIGTYRLTVTDIFGKRYDVEDRHRTTSTNGGFDAAELFELAGAAVVRS